jgi:dTDP-4-amino-4,6-dideoxygalactose transaminase
MDKLAIAGGKPVREKPFPPRILFDEKEREAVLNVVEKTMTGPEAIDLYGTGPEVEAYRQEFAAFFGVKFATPTTSGTAAVHAALGSLRLEPGTEVITSPITDPGTVAPILMQNCIPVFADVDYETLNVTAVSVEKMITKKTKVIIPVHLAGQPCDMDPIMELANKRDLIVIEDSAQAHGVKYKGDYVGSIGHLGVFSLMAGKHTTSGGQGGMVITNDEELYWNAKRFADRGKPFNSDNPTNLFLGMNYRMTELQAVIGRVQLGKLRSRVEKRQMILKRLQDAMAGLEAFRLGKTIDGAEPNPWFCFLHYDSVKMKVDKEQCAKAIAAEGIPVGAHYTTLMYEQTWIRDKNTYGNSHCPWSCPFGRNIDYRGTCPNAERALQDHMALYFHEGWGEKEIEDAVAALQKIERHYLR